MRLGRGAVVCLLAAALAAGCAMPLAPPPVPLSEKAVPVEDLSPAEQYAGRVLAYLMQVVLGCAGPRDLRSEWASRGLDVPLDFAHISAIMLEPGRNRARLMVLDTRILGVSEVLYHYDPRLNLFKGDGDRQSLFPSAELMAVRLLLLQKMARGEKMRLGALAAKRALLSDPKLPLTGKDLAETGLGRSEMSLLRAVLASDPHLFGYLVYPPMVRTLYRIGAAAYDPLVAACLAPPVLDADAEACRFSQAGSELPALQIALLPSITRQFSPAGPKSPPGAAFTANGFYRRVTESLKRKITREVAAKVPGAEGRLLFSEPFSRPQVVYPENEKEQIRRVCPRADFVVILLGKDVIRSFDPAPGGETAPGAARLYIDLMDIERSLISPELDVLSRFAASRLVMK